MTFNNLFKIGLGLTLLVAACSSNSNNGGPVPLPPTINLPNGPVLGTLSGPNVLSITVNGSNCSAGSYFNKPCASVTICSTGNANCQTVNDLLVDTGSYGLRVFKDAMSSALATSLTPIMNGGMTLGECVVFGDGSSEWGPVAQANISLGGESAVTVPMHIVDASFSTRPSACQNADTSAANAGFNGILGIGLFIQDCGDYCRTTTNNNTYFACNGSGCSPTTVSLANQVQNPVAALPQDNNGVIVELPSVPLSGAGSVNGYLVLGIGTQSNNPVSGVTGFSTDGAGDFTTTFNGQNYSNSYLDTGSNGLFFTATSNLPSCGGSNSSWFCPSYTLGFSAVVTGTNSATVPFDIGNFVNLANTGNQVFSDIGGDGSGTFDFGLPFHLGRNVYVGIENRSSPLGTGPYWGF